MIQLIPFQTRVTLSLYMGAFLLFITLFLIDKDPTFFEIIGVFAKVVGIFTVLLTLVITWAWRLVWMQFPKLNTQLFPDLNGDWNITIHWLREGKSGEVHAKAKIEQTLISLKMEVYSEDSDSETLLAKPKRGVDSLRPLLYYVYRVTPKQKNGVVQASYEGTAILLLDPYSLEKLGGNYFTNQLSKGRFELVRTTC